MRPRTGLPTAAALMVAAVLLAAVAGPPAAAAPHSHGKKQRLRIGLAKRVAVARAPMPKPKRPFGDLVLAMAKPVPSPPPASDGLPLQLDSPPPPPPSPRACTEVVAAVAVAEAAVRAADPGAVICLADGSYGPLTLDASKSAAVILQAQHPGAASLAGVTLSGSHLSVERFQIGDEVVVLPGSSSISIAHNRISGGYFGVNAGPTATTTIDDTTVVGNRFVGPFGEDAIHLNRYHDSDGDGVGILIEGNEITNVRENGNHSDCLQTVWVGDHIVFRKNYLHDNRCQGFFVKDQDMPGEASGPVVGLTVENNLFLRNDAPCAPPELECGDPSYFHVFGPYSGLSLRRNTIWAGEPVASFQEGAGADTVLAGNVVYRFWTATDLSAIDYRDNTVCQREISGGVWPDPVLGETIDCAPAFADPPRDDYRLPGSERGIDWAPAQQHYGP